MLYTADATAICLHTFCSLPVKPYICFLSIIQEFISYIPSKFWENGNEMNPTVEISSIQYSSLRSYPFHLQNPPPRGGWSLPAAALLGPESISPRSNSNSFCRTSIFCSRSWISETSSCPSARGDHDIVISIAREYQHMKGCTNKLYHFHVRVKGVLTENWDSAGKKGHFIILFKIV